MIRATAIACVAAALTSPAHSLELKHVTTPDGNAVIRADGDIDGSDPAKFLAFVHANKLKDAALIINSGGGSVAAGMTLGRTIRAMGMPVFVTSGDICYSACAFVFAGGADRIVQGGRLGVHQFRFAKSELPEDAASESQAISAAVVDYFVEMGIDVRVATNGMTTPPSEMLVFTEQELVAFNLVTWKPEAKAAMPGCPFPAGQPVNDPLGLYPGCHN